MNTRFATLFLVSIAGALIAFKTIRGRYCWHIYIERDHCAVNSGPLT
jgi:hypothetical protein